MLIENLRFNCKLHPRNKIKYMSKIAYVFPGQGAQYPGMGKELFDKFSMAKTLYNQANELLGFKISDIMFEGSEEELKQTKITQPAVFLDSVIQAFCYTSKQPDMVAGHSLGEISALVVAKAISFEEGLLLVYERALSMQVACELSPSTMAAVLGLEDAKVEEICATVNEGIVVPANYNCPGQLVISGEINAVEIACEKLKAAGAKRAMLLPVGGAFHSPLMLPAQERLAIAIQKSSFKSPICPVYQNVSTIGETNAETIKANLLQQLTAPVKWTQSVRQMHADGANLFVEFGPGKVLQGLVKKIAPEAQTSQGSLLED
jgi:[acyl-carrier-protein] S-malonyltransferase